MNTLQKSKIVNLLMVCPKLFTKRLISNAPQKLSSAAAPNPIPVLKWEHQEIEGQFKGLQIQVVKKEHHDAVLRHVEEIFMVTEPFCQFYGAIQDPDYIKDQLDFAREGLEDGLSMVALDSAREVAGVRISRKYTRSLIPTKPKVEDYNSSNAYRLYKIMYELESTLQPNLFDRYNIEELLELRLLSVHPKYQKLGLGTEFYFRNTALAKSQGLSVAKVFVSGAFSKRAAEKSGLQIVNSVSYDDYQENGKYVLKDMPHPHKMFALAIQVL